MKTRAALIGGLALGLLLMYCGTNGVPDWASRKPTFPHGQFGLAIKSWKAAQKVKSKDRPAEAQVLSESLLSATEGSGGQAMIDAFQGDMKAKFTASQKTAWEPWRQMYLSELQALQDEERLTGKPEWTAAFNEMSLGLSAVEK